jgi:Zn-dependent protease
MRWSYRLFKFKGISVELHLSFIVFYALILAALGLKAALFFTLIFTIVLAHEFVHSLTAIIHGINVPRITLLPIGGLASIELPDNPELELKVSIVGPLFNFFLAGLGFILYYLLTGQTLGVGQITGTIITDSFGMESTQSALSVFVYVNFILGAFNMLPAFPMDGGRVFRSILAFWMDYSKATRIATFFGQTIFLALSLLGILTFNLWWIVIGLFLYSAGGSELKYTGLRRAMKGVRVKDLLSDRIRYANRNLTWSEFMERIYDVNNQYYLLITPDGVLEGLLDVSAVKSPRSDSSIGDFANTEYALINAGIPADKALKILLSNRIIIAVEADRIIGFLDAEKLNNQLPLIALKSRLINGFKQVNP